MSRNYSIDKLNENEIIEKREYNDVNVVLLDTASCRGNYGYTRIKNAKNVVFNDGVQFDHIHISGKTVAENDVRITFYGVAKNDGLCNIVAHAKYHGYYVKTVNNNFKIMSGISNKFHGLGTWQKFILKHCTNLHCNIEEYNHNNNTLLNKYNLDGYDVVKFLQKYMDRGFPAHMVTNREDYI